MLENLRRNKIKTLEPKRSYIINDINIKEYDLSAVMTMIIVPTLFLLSMQLIVSAGL